MIRGRKSRNRTLSTKPTEAEDRRVEEAASAEQRTAAEWLRGLAFERLRANGRDAGSVELFEVVEFVSCCSMSCGPLAPVKDSRSKPSTDYSTRLVQLNMSWPED